MLSNWKLLAAAALLLTEAAANPLIVPRGRLGKRSNPTIGSGFNTQQTTQLNDGFLDAIKLASSAYSAVGGSIFKKYFNDGDANKVRNVFLNIMGNPSDPSKPDPTGSSKLGDISIVQDYPDAGGDLACDGETMAELRDWGTNNPKLVMCGPGFGHGGINKGYNNVPEINCAYIGDRVNWRMDTMGSILLHEYTHFKNLVSPPLSKETDDDEYGPTGVRGMNKNKATNNADSYSWFANEALWSVLCTKSYGDPIAPEDDDDPNCDGIVCKASKSKSMGETSRETSVKLNDSSQYWRYLWVFLHF